MSKSDGSGPESCITETATSVCEGCGKTFQHCGCRSPAYCSQQCEEAAKSDSAETANRKENPKTKRIRVDKETREELKRLRDGREKDMTYSETVAWLTGEYMSGPLMPVSEPEPCITGPKRRTIAVGESCHEVLTDLREKMGLSSLGDVIAVLIENHVTA